MWPHAVLEMELLRRPVRPQIEQLLMLLSPKLREMTAGPFLWVGDRDAVGGLRPVVLPDVQQQDVHPQEWAGEKLFLTQGDLGSEVVLQRERIDHPVLALGNTPLFRAPAAEGPHSR